MFRIKIYSIAILSHFEAKNNFDILSEKNAKHFRTIIIQWEHYIRFTRLKM